MVDLNIHDMDFSDLTGLEWLVTNGIGGYASGTISGVLTRRYHGYLVAAVTPPVERVNLVPKIDEWVRYKSRVIPFSQNQWKIGQQPVQTSKNPDSLSRFHLDASVPTWTFVFDRFTVQKQVWMQYGKNTTYLHYTYLSGDAEIKLTFKALLADSDFHQTNQVSNPYTVLPVENGFQVKTPSSKIDYFLLSDRADCLIRDIWIRDYYLAQEDYRGLDCMASYFNGADFSVRLQPGQSVTIVLSTDSNPLLDGAKALATQKARQSKLLQPIDIGVSPAWVQQLILAADQFIVERKIEDEIGHSVIAGYHWFSDWGRDTMIALPGLTLAAGRFDLAESILRTFARYVDQGMLPNRFPDLGEEPEYNTIDATLWYFEAIYRTYQSLLPIFPERAKTLIGELFPILAGIIQAHELGTRYRIHVDPVDGLLYGGEPGVQLTWMDAKVDGFVVTPRMGKPVEINALWYSALSIMAEFTHELGLDAEAYKSKARRVQNSFSRFWNDDLGYCYDVIDSPDGDDRSCRPNQVIAASVTFSPLATAQQRQVLEACERKLLTPSGLCSLSPDHPDYASKYGGDIWQRDTAYHQGTVWGWLIGPYLSAHLRVYGDKGYVSNKLQEFVNQLEFHGIGFISEIFDGDYPHTARGCIAQAWSIAAALQVWGELGQIP